VDKNNCWKCNEQLVRGCPSCDSNTISLIVDVVNRASSRSDEISKSLEALRAKIKSHKDNLGTKKDISFAVNTLCNIIDLLNEGDSHLICNGILAETEEKAKEIITLTQTLRSSD